MGMRLNWSVGLSVVALLGMARGAGAQERKALGLGEVLQRLEANLKHYDAGLPSLFCDEHLVSSRVVPGERDINKTTESTFRLKRVEQEDGTTGLVESRETKAVDGRAVMMQKADGPALLTGIFEGGVAVVSVGQAACMKYRLERGKAGAPYVVRFVTVLLPQNTADCLLQEKSSGRVVIDPATMQVTRLEITTPKHRIVEGDWDTQGEVGRRELAVDYAPELLGGERFWMPSEIAMKITSGSGFDVTVWRYRATYGNYHRLTVTSRILTKPD